MTSLLGFMMLVGIVVNNGILYVDYTNQLRQEGMDIEEALIETGVSRLRPILMTTLTTIISMLPFVLGIGKNTDTMQGMALVICGGLIASTILTLLMLPVFYMVIEKFARSGAEKKAAKLEKKALKLEKKEAKKAAKEEKKADKTPEKVKESDDKKDEDDSEEIDIVDIEKLDE